MHENYHARVTALVAITLICASTTGFAQNASVPAAFQPLRIELGQYSQTKFDVILEFGNTGFFRIGSVDGTTGPLYEPPPVISIAARLINNPREVGLKLCEEKNLPPVSQSRSAY